MDKLNDMISRVGLCHKSDDSSASAPLALFDWDNTVVRNDIGEIQSYWMIANGKVKQPPEAEWSAVSSYSTPEAVSALNSACGPLASPGQTLPTDSSAGLGCADELIEILGSGKTMAGDIAFEGFNARRMEPQYALVGQLLAGYSSAEIREFAASAREQSLNAAEGATQIIGTHEVNAWVRYYDQIADLIKALRDNGFDVRVISASPQAVAEEWGEPAGFTQDKVMGIKTTQVDGLLTSSLAPCGGDEASIPYIEGKRCRINEEVFGVSGPAAFEPAAESQRQVFAAGDSDTDVTFLSDATELSLTINRNKVEPMCRAYANEDGKWLVNPMFIELKGQHKENYKCSEEGRIEPDGSKGPLTDDDGQVVSDQADSVFAES